MNIVKTGLGATAPAAILAATILGAFAAPAQASTSCGGYEIECHQHGNCTICWEKDGGGWSCEVETRALLELILPNCFQQTGGGSTTPDSAPFLGPQTFSATLPDSRPQQLQTFVPPVPPTPLPSTGPITPGGSVDPAE